MAARRAALALAAAALAGAAISLPAAAAQGEAPEVGWWTVNQIAGLPIGRAALVPPGGSQVASGSDGPVSVAAVRFPAGGGATYEVGIELGSDADTATVVACPIVEAWEPVSGGPLADAPAWDCTLGEATGTIDPDAATVTWQLPAELVRDGVLDVILVPTDGGASFTLTMSAPADDAVTPSSEPAPTTTSSLPQAGAPTGPTATTSPPGPTPVPVRVPAPALAPGAAPTSSAPVGLPSPLPTTTGAPGSGTELAGAAVPVPSSTTGRVLGGLVLALVVAAVAALARRAPVVATGPQPDARGVGRFVRPRDEPPLAI
ncbi:MAG TPA: hypothetical protein VFU14_20610 [Acidimicrobiales bacterium]|nr:hypothetical protein [Acidimicrobiales bacterium]